MVSQPTTNNQQPTTTSSHSPSETLALARRLAKKVRPGETLGLQGPLGSGKTTFAKGLIAALTGIAEEEITSPSFTLVEEYPGEIYHVDLYRLEKPQEAAALPWDELLGPEAITLVEWPENWPPLISHCQWMLQFSKKGKEVRFIEISHKEKP
jgi:tRNA threonylcarbamoyl adenosine modification protein YjeE